VDASRAPNRNYAVAGALFDELLRAGVRHVCVCPGSRSAPLAAAAARTPGLRVFSLLDERCAGFFALGLAKGARAPAAVVCTSGTAVANLLPAAVEASHGGVPLLLLTADRPPELRGWGAPQTIDQLHIFGPHVRLFVDAPLPEASGAGLRHARALAARAVAAATGRPPGPVHLNLPFREPLEPAPVPADGTAALSREEPEAARGRAAGPWLRAENAPAAPPAGALTRLAERIASTPNGVIVAGPLDAEPGLPAAATRLARAAGWPLLAEPTSQLRRGPHVTEGPLLGAYDAFLRDEAFAAAHAPACVLRLGAPSTSKPVARWLERHADAELWLVDPDGGFADPTHRACEVVRADPALLCDALRAALAGGADAGRGAEPRPSPWLQAFLEAERRGRRALGAALEAEKALLSPRLVIELAEALPENATLFVSNSLPVRDLDGFLPVARRGLRVLCNRGANGIDGIVSSALGASAGGARPLALLTGDLAFLHDLGGLLAARRHALDATLVVVNNGGGGIFSHLPVARHREAVDFDTLFTAPHGLDLAHAARLFDATHARVGSWEELRWGLARALEGGLHVLEVPVDPEADLAHHHALWRAVSDALAGPEDAP